ncbi:hypothetical protein [Terricaulis sp.]|uniref:hypothetical protein n=1 Tax=Terricaulis sp. TaxID=2768686 RepID=UPI002AC4F67C|nr:hypothetical protein [Terricaulis sp.]MDZ4691622.1 hypothetical protein [Terricaulis sp.]
MHRTLETIDLGENGAAYITTRLSELRWYGGPLETFCDALADLVRTKAGKVVTNLPIGLGHEQVHAFESGGVLPSNPDPSGILHLPDGSAMLPIESVFDEEFARLRARLLSAPNLACVVVDPQSRRGDPCLDENWETMFYAGDGVYQLVTSATSDELAERALNAAPHWADLIVLSSAPPKLSAERSVDPTDLKACAEAALEITCSAYDGEGYITWRAPPPCCAAE